VKMILLLQAEITKMLAGEIYLLYEIEHSDIVLLGVLFPLIIKEFLSFVNWNKI